MSRGDQVAFPADSRKTRTFAGLSVREYAAIQAMQGLLASRTRYADHWRIEWDSIASCAVKQADALLAALQRPQRDTATGDAV